MAEYHVARDCRRVLYCYLPVLWPSCLVISACLLTYLSCELPASWSASLVAGLPYNLPALGPACLTTFLKYDFFAFWPACLVICLSCEPVCLMTSPLVTCLLVTCLPCDLPAFWSAYHLSCLPCDLFLPCDPLSALCSARLCAAPACVQCLAGYPPLLHSLHAGILLSLFVLTTHHLCDLTACVLRACVFFVQLPRPIFYGKFLYKRGTKI
jgi:hypothetical protein